MAGRFKTLMVNGLLVVVALGVSLAIAEVAVRTFYPQPTGLSHQDPYGLPMHWPGITRYLPQYGHEVSFNSAGMRDIEHPIEKTPGVYRILLLGDSFMEALQVPFDSSFPGHLQRMLEQRSGRRVEVVNAGVSGWGTDDELRYLTRYGRRYRADLVLVAMTLHNDLSDNARQAWHRLDGDTLVEVNPPPIPAFTYRTLQLKGWISTHFQTYQLWRRVRHGGEIARVGRQLNTHVIELFQAQPPERIVASARLTGKLLGEIKTVAEADGGRLAVVLLPLRYQLADTLFNALAESAGDAGKTMQVERPQQLVRPLLDSLGVPTVDLLPPFRRWSDSGGPSLYVEWDGHWNAAGHHLAAQVTAAQLLADSVVR